MIRYLPLTAVPSGANLDSRIRQKALAHLRRPVVAQARSVTVTQGAKSCSHLSQVSKAWWNNKQSIAIDSCLSCIGQRMVIHVPLKPPSRSSTHNRFPPRHRYLYLAHTTHPINSPFHPPGMQPCPKKREGVQEKKKKKRKDREYKSPVLCIQEPNIATRSRTEGQVLNRSR